MNIIGLDIGTTTLSAVLLQENAPSPIARRTVAHSAFLPAAPYEKIQDAEKIAATEEAVREINPAISVKRTQFGAFDPAWLEAIIPQADIDGAIHKADITLQKACLHISAEMSAEKLRVI